MKKKNPVQIFTGFSLLHPHRAGMGTQGHPQACSGISRTLLCFVPFEQVCAGDDRSTELPPYLSIRSSLLSINLNGKDKS